MKSIILTYVNLVVCLTLFAFGYRMTRHLTFVDHKIQIMIQNDPLSAHSESYDPKDPITLLCWIFVVALIFTANQFAISYLNNRALTNQ